MWKEENNRCKAEDNLLNPEFSSESDNEFDKTNIFAAINAIDESNTLSDEVAEESGNLKVNIAQSRRKRSVPVKRCSSSKSNEDLNDDLDNEINLNENNQQSNSSLSDADCSGDCASVGEDNSEQKFDAENFKGPEATAIHQPKMKFMIDKTTNTSGGALEPEMSNSNDEKSKGKHFLDNYKWHCTRCPAIVDTLNELRAHHENAHNQPASFKCVQCNKVYTRYRSFARHVRLHGNPKSYECEICRKTFAQKTVLIAHATVHTDNRPHVCKHCGKSFKQFSSLYCHSKNHLPEKLKFPCPICNKEFSTKHTLESHKKIHTGERDFICDICGKSFVAKGSLDYHILSHNNTKPHICQSCGKAFKTPRLLDKHSTLHTGIKPHHCEVCGKQFREKGALREHNRIHTGAMPYSCEFCGKTFRFKGILTVHRRQHTGERPYGCTDCKKYFTNWANYNKHMKRRHKNEYTPTNVSGRNKYKPPFLNQNKNDLQDSKYLTNGSGQNLINGENSAINVHKTDSDFGSNQEGLQDFVGEDSKQSDGLLYEEKERFSETQEIKEFSHSIPHDYFENKDAALKPEFLKEENSMEVLDMTRHNQRNLLSQRNVMDDDIFNSIAMAHAYVTNDVHPHGSLYNCSNNQNGKTFISHYDNAHTKILSQDEVFPASSMAYIMSLHYDQSIDINLLQSRIN